MIRATMLAAGGIVRVNRGQVKASPLRETIGSESIIEVGQEYSGLQRGRARIAIRSRTWSRHRSFATLVRRRT